MKKLTVFLSTTLFLTSCQKAVECFTPPPQVTFEIVNSANQNLIENGSIDEKTIQIQEETKEGPYTSTGYTLTADKLLFINNAGWEDGTKNYRFISKEVTFNFHIKSSDLDSKRCGGRQIDEVKFFDVNYKLENGIFKVIPE